MKIIISELALPSCIKTLHKMQEIEVFKSHNSIITTEKIKVNDFSENGFNYTNERGTSYWVFPKRVVFGKESDRVYASKYPQYFLKKERE